MAEMADSTTSGPPPPPPPAAPSAADDVSITVHYKGQHHTQPFPAASTLSDLSRHVTALLALPEASQKFLVSPRPGLLKPPFAPDSPNGALTLASIAARKITLIGSTPAEVSSLDAAIATSQRQADPRRGHTGPVRAATPARTRDWRALQDSTRYTFGDCRPLPHLPKPERSLRFLERLRDDPGIKSVMAARKFTVGLLTEMDPAEHTTHESRTLGLNRNAGEVIELRLRTDAYDGYRDYRTIRKTLCHELTHNVFGDHDKNFWALCVQIEKEVERADWKSGGHTVGAQEFYNPHDRGVEAEGQVHDHGAWSGEAHVLGRAGTSSGGGSGGSSGGPASAAGRREEMARAAEERAKRQQEQHDRGGRP